MTQYNTPNKKLYNSQLSKLKSAIKNGTGVTLDLSSKILMMKIIFVINYSWLIHKFQGFVKPLQKILQLI